MSMIEIKDWKGHELMDDYLDFIVTGTVEAKAIASKVTGRMVNSVIMRKTSGGYEVVADKNLFNSYKGQKPNKYYAYTYAVVGYTRYSAFHFIHEAFETVADGEHIFKYGRWSAKKPSGRNGSGTTYLGNENRAFIQDQKESWRAKAERTTGPNRLLFSKYS